MIEESETAPNLAKSPVGGSGLSCFIFSADAYTSAGLMDWRTSNLSDDVSAEGDDEDDDDAEEDAEDERMCCLLLCLGEEDFWCSCCC